MFATEAIILLNQKIRDAQFRIVVFTEEYGKISCWFYKSQFLYDIGDRVFMQIDRREGRNFIKKIESKSSPGGYKWKYTNLKKFLELIRMYLVLLGDSMVYGHVFADYRELLTYLHSHEIKNERYTLLHMRLLKQLGILGDEEFQKKALLQYIYHNIDKRPLRDILTSKDIQQDDIECIEKINSLSIQRFLQ